MERRIQAAEAKMAAQKEAAEAKMAAQKEAAEAKIAKMVKQIAIVKTNMTKQIEVVKAEMVAKNEIAESKIKRAVGDTYMPSQSSSSFLSLICGAACCAPFLVSCYARFKYKFRKGTHIYQSRARFLSNWVR